MSRGEPPKKINSRFGGKRKQACDTRKKISEIKKKPLDKINKIWYNKYTK